MTEITNNPNNFDDVVDLHSVPGGEYKVRFLGYVGPNINKNGGEYYQARLEVADDPYAKDFTYYLGLPTGAEDAKQMNQMKVKIRDFCLAFGAKPPTSKQEFKDLMEGGDLVGMEAWAVLREDETEEYGMQNEVKRFIKPV